jgi:two-component system chemotaxis response regulator CheB
VIRILIVDDSALMRRLLSDVFAGEPDFETHVARDGLEALALNESVRPDVVTLDVQMPHMDGLTCLDRIMLQRPCAVVMLSSLTRESADETLRALSLGAVDFVTKPEGAVSLQMEEFGPLLVDVVRRAAVSRPRATHRLAERIRLSTTAAPRAPGQKRKRRKAAKATDASPGLVLVGTSTGGPPALDALLSPLPADFAWPILVAQHMPAAFTEALARRLDRLCALSVVEVSRPVPLVGGRVYIGRGNADLIVSLRPEGLVAMSAPAASEYLWHPSVDRLVDSAMQHVAAENLAGVLMTGMGNDGARSMAAMRAAGGHTIAEAEETAVVWGMPGALVRAEGASDIVPLRDIAASLMDHVGVSAQAGPR